MEILLSKIPRAVVFANFFLQCAAAWLCAFPLYAQAPSSFHSLLLPDASGTTVSALLLPHANPALFSSIDSSALAVAVTPSRFGIAELTHGELVYAAKAHIGTCAIALKGMGNTLYNEFSATGFVALAPSPVFNAGIAVEYNRLGIRDYPAQTLFQCHLGARIRLVDSSLTAGIALHNLARAHWGDAGSTTEQSALFSLGAPLTADITAAASVLVRLNYASSFVLTASHTVLSAVQLRLGVQTYPRSAEGTVLWNAGATAFTGTVYYHDELGISQRIGCMYQW